MPATIHVLEAERPQRELPEFTSITPVHRTQWATLAALSITLCAGPLMFGSVQPWAYVLLGFGILATLLTLIIERILRADFTVELSSLLLPSALFAVVVGIQLATGATAYRYVTQVEAAKWFYCALVIFIVANAVRSDRELRILAMVLGCFGFAFALFAMLQQLSSATRIYGFHSVLHPQNLYGSYPNRDHYSGLMEMLVPLPLAVSLATSLPKSVRALLAGAAVVMGASVVLSASRAGMVAVIAEVIFLSVYLGSGGRGKRYFALLIAFFAATCTLLYWIDASPALLRWKQLSIEDELSSGRLAIALDALRMWKVHPWLGFGLGAFTTVYPQYRSFYTDLIVNQVHNDYLQVLVETGIFGAVAMLWFVATLYRSGMMSRRSTRGDLRDLIRLGALTGCTGLLVHSFFDFNLHIPANAVMFFALATLVCLPSRGNNGYTRA
jgi:O-antigen ligase